MPAFSGRYKMRTDLKTNSDRSSTSKQNPKSSRKPCFYALPAEIRLIVYDYILDDYSNDKMPEVHRRSKIMVQRDKLVQLFGCRPSNKAAKTLFVGYIGTALVPHHIEIRANIHTWAVSVSKGHRAQVVTNAQEMPAITLASKAIRQEILPAFFSRFYALNPQNEDDTPWFARSSTRRNITSSNLPTYDMSPSLCKHSTRFIYHRPNSPIILTFARRALPLVHNPEGGENPYTITLTHKTLWTMTLTILQTTTFTRKAHHQPSVRPAPSLHPLTTTNFSSDRPEILLDEDDPRRPGVIFARDFAEALSRDLQGRFCNTTTSADGEEEGEGEELGGSAERVARLWERCRFWEERAMEGAVRGKGGRWVLDGDLRR
jgi:hypothetical protein